MPIVHDFRLPDPLDCPTPFYIVTLSGAEAKFEKLVGYHYSPHNDSWTRFAMWKLKEYKNVERPVAK